MSQVMVPDIPYSLDIKIKRERYLAKEALQDAEHVLHKVGFNESSCASLEKYIIPLPCKGLTIRCNLCILRKIHYSHALQGILQTLTIC